MPSALTITAIDLFPLREPVSGAEYSIVRVRAGALTGYGECARASAQDLAAARRFWVGRDAISYATASREVQMAGATDMALLDIVGKSCKAPIYRVLGGPTRWKVRVYASVNELSLATGFGYRAIGLRVPSATARNQGQAYQIAIRKLLEAARAHGVDAVLEAEGALTPGDAASVATTVAGLHPLWFDDPCGVANLQTVHNVAGESVTPLGFGRGITEAAAFQDLLRDGLVDVVRPDLHHFGLTQSRRLGAMAETYYVGIAPRHVGGPIATAAALQLAASLPNFIIQQIPLPASAEDRAMRAAIAGTGVERVSEGFAAVPVEPGLGIQVDERALERYRAA